MIMLGNNMLTEVRQRLTQETKGRRGRFTTNHGEPRYSGNPAPRRASYARTSTVCPREDSTRGRITATWPSEQNLILVIFALIGGRYRDKLLQELVGDERSEFGIRITLIRLA
jgi:hypothetical protein